MLPSVVHRRHGAISMTTASIAYVFRSLGLHHFACNTLSQIPGHVGELRRSHEHLDQRRTDHPACVDCIQGASLSSEESLCGVDFCTAAYVSAPRNDVPSVILTESLESVSLRLVSSSTGTELGTLMT